MRTLGRLPRALALVALVAGCGPRDEVWDAPSLPPVGHGLTRAAALVDAPAERVLMLPIKADLSIEPVSIPIGRGYAASGTTGDRSRLLVLSRGDVPRRKADDDPPHLSVIEGDAAPRLLARYDLADPLSGLAIDPEARFAVVFPGEADSSFVENPNELEIVDLAAPPGDANPVPLTLRSFGGRPRNLVFTPELRLPGGARRLLAVLTDRDVGIIDLSHPAAGDVTVRLSSSGQRLVPAQIAVSDGDPAADDDARIAIRIEGDPGVILVDMLPVPAGEEATSAHDFRPTPNVVVADGVPSDVAFVTTDGGLRLAAVVPSEEALSLIDPATGIASRVDLGAPFERMSIVTGVTGPAAAGADVALCWSTSDPSIGFVALGSTVGKPYKSVERLELEEPVAEVIEVPPPNQHLRILRSASGSTFFVLDLKARTASPILAAPGAGVRLAPDGRRAWMLSPSTDNLAALDLATLHPKNLVLGYPVADAFDVARADGGRALVAVHHVGAVSLTILDGERPSLETAVDYVDVLLGSLR